jgi:hypothetical protein
MPSAGNTCSACAHWDADPNIPDSGYCHFNAPRVVNERPYASSTGPPYTLWPATTGKDWCSNYASTPPAQQMPVASGVAVAPPASASTTEVMAGLGAMTGFSVTPNRTGRVVAIVSGCCANDAANGGINITGRHGTGTAPASLSTATGAVWATTQHYYMAAAKDVSGFTVVGGNPNLALGVPVWFDLSFAAVGGGNASLTDVQCLLFEL